MADSFDRDHTRDRRVSERLESLHIQLLGSFQVAIGARTIGE